MQCAVRSSEEQRASSVAPVAVCEVHALPATYEGFDPPYRFSAEDMYGIRP